MKKILLVLIGVMSLSLSGCTVLNSGNKNISDDNLIKEVVTIGESKSEILKNLGNPTSTEFKDNGNEVWTYIHSKGNMSPLTFIPIIGLVASMDGVDAETKTVKILFDVAGKVIKYSTGSQNTDTGLF